MARLQVAAILLALGLCQAAPVMAAPVFVDDFQDGQADGWGAAGAGDVKLTNYQGNISLNLTGRAVAMTEVSTVGFGEVKVAASLAALGLGGKDSCLAELSTDGGATWLQIVSVRDGEDDGVTLRRAEVSPAGAANNPRVLVRFRADGGRGAQCWGDGVTVSGEALEQGARLDRETLLSGAMPGPITMSALGPPTDAVAPEGRFEGRLRLDTTSTRLTLKRLRDEAGDSPEQRAARASLPPFDFAFVQDGAALIPVLRGPQRSDHPDWEWVIGPGAIWREADGSGWLRASIPFALQERNTNCLHNGVLTLAFAADGRTSNAALQIASETCAYLKFDAWGMAPASVVRTSVSGADDVVAAYRAEVAARLPVRDISELAARYPGLDPARLGLATPVDGDPPAAFGLVVDGIHYAGPCRTRHGDYPFCSVLALPSYSTAKSIVGGVGLMRLEVLHPGAASGLLRDHVAACAAGKTWAGVTLMDALDMATGVYDSDGYEVDENAAATLAFFAAEDHVAKIDFACKAYSRRTAPGRRFVYHTTDTYLLGAAMSDIARKDSLGDFYTGVVAPLWRDLKLSPLIMDSRRTRDATAQPFTGWGLTYHSDDVVRIAGWLATGALIDGRPALDQTMLDAALQKDPERAGLQAGGAAYRYKGGFWARDLGPVLGCKAPLWTPFMSGYGGISVIMLPGNVTFYYFGDSSVFDWAPAAVEAAKTTRMCP